MEYADLELIAAIERAGSLSAAADALFTSQPALTRRLRALEEEAGVRLVERRPGVRTTSLTEAGRRLAAQAPRWRELLDELARPAEERRLFSVGCVHSVSVFLLGDTFPAFARAHPEISLEVSVQHSVNSYELVRTGRLAAGLVADTQHAAGIAALPLFSESYLLASSTLVDGAPVRPQDLDPAREVRVPWHPNLQEWHRYWMGGALPFATTDEMSLLVRFLQEEGTWALVQASAVGALCETGIACAPLSDPPADVTCHLIVAERGNRKLVDDLAARIRADMAGRTGITVLGAAEAD